MSAYRSARAKYFVAAALGCLTLAIALSHAPAAASTSDADDEMIKTASINIPLNKIQDGQWCVAYANVFNASPPYQYLWSGSYFSGTTQVVGAFMSGSGGYVDLRVIDSAGDTIFAPTVFPNVGDYDYNEECEG